MSGDGSRYFPCCCHPFCDLHIMLSIYCMCAIIPEDSLCRSGPRELSPSRGSRASFSKSKSLLRLMETPPAVSLYELKFTFLITLRRPCFFLPPALILHPAALWRLLNCVQAPSPCRLPRPRYLCLSPGWRRAHLGGAEV